MIELGRGRLLAGGSISRPYDRPRSYEPANLPSLAELESHLLLQHSCMHAWTYTVHTYFNNDPKLVDRAIGGLRVSKSN
jgi:hypothetical protein